MKRVIKHLLFIILLTLTFPPSLYAQGGTEVDPAIAEPHLRFEHITTDDGLSHLTVSSILQDSQGFMWFGTEDGLDRYDGHKLKSYRFNADDPHSLSQNGVESLYIDAQGVLWVGTEDGLNKFDRALDRFTRYQHDPDDPSSMTTGYVHAIFQDQEGFLWVGTRGGLNKFDPATEQFTHYLHDPDDPNSLGHNRIHSILPGQDGVLWIGTRGGGLNKFDPATEQFTRYLNDPDDPNSLSHKRVYSILPGRDGVLWLGTAKGLNKFDPATEQFTRYFHDPDDPNSLSDDYVATLLLDQDGVLWVGTEVGLNKLDLETGKFTRYLHSSENPASLTDNEVVALYQDNTSALWIGTYKGGVNKLDLDAFKFTLTFFGYKVNGVTEDNAGNVWVMVDGDGLYRVDAKTQQVTVYRHDPDDPHSLSTNNNGAIYADSSGNIWIATDGEGVDKLDPETGQVTRYSENPNIPDLMKHDIETFYEDQAGIMWVLSEHDWSALFRLDPKTNQVTTYPWDPDNPDSPNVVGFNGNAIAGDPNGMIWIGNWDVDWGGVDKFDPQTEQFTHYRHDPDNPNSLILNKLAGIYADPSGLIWFGTDAGLDKFDPQTETFTHYREKDGLPSDIVRRILGDEQGNLWISTARGLARFDPQTETFTAYTPADGLQHNQFSTSAAHKSESGRLYFGGPNGLNSFYAAEITANANIPPVVLTDFQMFNESVEFGGEDSPLQQHINELEEITLPYNQAVFSFEFAALNYQNSSRNQYAYKMDGLDPDWNYVDSRRRFASYTRLDPGNYTFRVKASNNDGVWNEQARTIKVTITPPWWQTPWFRGLALVLAVGLVVGSYRWRVSAIENRNRELEGQVTARTKELAQSNEQLTVAKEQAEVAQEKAEVANQAKSTFLSNMSHELRTPLNGILGYAQILKRRRGLDTTQRDGLNIIRQSGEHLLTLINDILDLSKIEADKMELYPIPVNLPSFLAGIAGLIRMRAEEKNIYFKFAAAEQLPSGVEMDETRLRQVLLNLLGNAVKFTQQGQVTLRVSAIGRLQSEGKEQRQRLRFEAEDEGVGMSAEEVAKIYLPFEQVGDTAARQAGTGLGLTISWQLVELMGGELQVKSEKGKGSLFWFEVALPVIEALQVATMASKQVKGYEGPRRTILVADDKRDNRLVLISMLEPLGFEVVLVKNGQEEVDKAREIRPDLILSDLVMPVKTGFEAVEELRQDPDFKETPIFAVSASVFDMDQSQSQVIGCDAFIPKPVDEDKLLTLIGQHLQLEWIYEEAEAVVEAEGVDEKLVPPPAETLEALYELAMLGDMRELRNMALELGNEDDKYVAFVQKIKTLTRGFKQKELLALFEQYLEN